jgi:hypothetical protein
VTGDEVRDLAKRLAGDVRATPEQKSLAKRRLDELQDAAPSAVHRIAAELETLRDEVERRKPRDTTAATALRWETLTSPLYDTETRWEKRASRQFWLGALVIPGLVIAMIAIVVYVNRELVMLFLVTELTLVALAYSYLILRVHQQASAAEERMAEKRVGLTFLRVVLEEFRDDSQFETLLRHGTQMFLGHQAPSTILLGPDDAVAMKQVLTSARGDKPKGKEAGE